MKKITDLREGDLLSMDAAAKLLCISKRTLEDWHQKARVAPDKYPRGIKMGRHIFWLKSRLVDYVNRRQAA